MWPNSFRGRGKGLLSSEVPDQFPSSYYAKPNPGFRWGGQTFNNQHQNRGKWGRAKPLYNQNYTPHSHGTNSSQIRPNNGRVGGVLSLGDQDVGLIDSTSSLPFTPPRTFGSQFTEPSTSSSNSRYYVHRQDQSSASVMSHASTRSTRVDSRARREVQERDYPGKYMCPKCDHNYQFQYINNKYCGNLPLVLHCGHTMCQECIYQGLTNNKINCPNCHSDSSLTQEQAPTCATDLYNVFRPNYHIFGVLSFHRGGERQLNLNSIGFVTQPSKKVSQTPVNSSENCCFSSCTKPATMYCPSCDGSYCSHCSTVVHKSAKNLMSHEPVPKRINKFTLSLKKCNQHPSMPIEFFCKTCDLSACCYCVLNQHSDHERVSLYQLNQAEMEEFSTLQKKVQPILKDVLTAQKKASKLTSFDHTPLKKQVCNYFAYYHSQLQTVESKLLEELDQFKVNYHGLEFIQTSLITSSEELKQLLALNLNRIGDKKLNLRAALEKLRNLHEIPRFLLNDAGQSYPIRFVPDDSILTNLPHQICLETNEGIEYRLVKEEELPEGYVMETDEEVDMSINTILNEPELQPVVSSNYSSSKSSRKSKPKSTRTRKAASNKSNMDAVELQHINSMDSFYVILKKDWAKLEDLRFDIEDYIKMGGGEPVAEPELNKMYLVMYINKENNKTEQMWCRARLHNIQNEGDDTLYEMFFIDYGKTQFVSANRIRDIPPSVCQKKPFALECMLHNPMNVKWKEKAHLSLARILNGKDVFMLRKSYNQGIYEVDLMIASSDEGLTSVIDILVHAYQVVDPINGPANQKNSLFEQINPHLTICSNGRKFVKNQKVKVVIANIVDPHNMFVHLVEYQEVFKNMCQSIKKIFKNSIEGACVPIEGTYALVEYRDPIRSNFHRAFIKSVDTVSEKVHVLLVDWGLNVVVSRNNVRPLEEPLARLESQAVLIKLAHIAPYNQKSVWARASTDFLQMFFKSRDVLKMMVHDKERELEVALFDCSKNVDVCINALMVESNYADSTGPISTKLNWPRYESSKPEFTEEDSLMSALLKKVIENSKDESDDEEYYTDTKKKRIEVIKVESPSVIWIKYFDYKDKERDMNIGLQAHYSTETKTKTEWEVGDLCVVELSDQFCRGKIQEVLDDKCKIFFIDKIVEETVPFDKIFEYALYFTQYPQFAFKCHLANIRPAGDTGNWSISSIEALQELCAKNNRLYSSITTEYSDSTKKTMPIYIWYGLVIRGGALDPDRIKYILINNSLAKLGFAYKVPVPKIKKATNGEELLKSLIKKSDDVPVQEEQNKSAVTESEISSEETLNVESDIDSIKNLTLEDQVSDEKQNDKSESETDGQCDKEQVELDLEDWLPPLRLLSTEFEARVTCIETGGHLYLHDKSVDQGYQNMEKNMKQFFESKPPEWTAHKWEPGHLCTIKYTDGNWYRGKVLKVVSPQCITVFMIDFGSDHVLPASVLYRELLYTNIPAFATKVMLNRVYAKAGAWLTSDYDYFQSLVSDWCRVVVQGPKEVELPLVEVYNAVGDNVNEKLIELCPNLSRSAVFPVSENEEETWIVVEAIEPVDLGNKVETDKYEVLPLPQDLLEGKWVLMEIGGVFDFRTITIRSSLVDENVVLRTMINEIQEVVSDLPPLTNLQVGTPCLAPFSQDDIYYRAKIIKVESDTVDVLFVDYGNHESVALSEVKTIPLQYLKLPQQCWEVYLNIEPTNEDFDLTPFTEFIKHLEQQKRHIKLVKEDPITVDIYHKRKLHYAEFLRNGSIKTLYQGI